MNQEISCQEYVPKKLIRLRVPISTKEMIHVFKDKTSVTFHFPRINVLYEPQCKHSPADLETTSLIWSQKKLDRQLV